MGTALYTLKLTLKTLDTANASKAFMLYETVTMSNQ